MATNSNNGIKSTLKLKSCKRCNKNVLNGPKCINCESVFHASCAKKSNYVTMHEDDILECCTSNTDDNGDQIDELFLNCIDNTNDDKVLNIHTFKYILKQKDIIIYELRERIKFLYEHINILKQCEITNDKESDKKVTKQKPLPNSPRNSSVNSFNTNVARPTILSGVSSTEVSKAILEVQTSKKMEDIINLDPPVENVNKNKNVNKWDKLNHNKRTFSRKTIVGENEDININGKQYEVVKKYKSLHVYRLDPKVSAADLEKFLTPNFPEIKCEVLQSKHPELYSSFKVSVFQQNLDQAMNPKTWPKGAHIQPFLVLRNRHNQRGS